MTTRAKIPNDTAGPCATCGEEVAAYAGSALRLQSRLFLYHNHCVIGKTATDAKRIKDFEHFARMKLVLVRKWGEKLITGTQADYDAIMKDCEPLAKFAKVQPARIHIGLCSAYRDDETTADVTLDWHPPQVPEPHWPNQDQKGHWGYGILRRGERIVGGTYTAPGDAAGRARALGYLARLCAEKGFAHYRLEGVVHACTP